MKLKYYLTCLVLLLFISCNKEEAIKWNLKEAVLSFYKDSVPNEDKYRAALFLLDNMDVHYSVYNQAIGGFYSFMDSVFLLPVQEDGFYNRMYDKAIRQYGRDMVRNQIIVPDTRTITAEYLIANIDSAYSMWNAKWAGEYSFEHFCNYVLPYRVCHEPVSDWRGKYMKQGLKKVMKLYDSQFNHTYIYGTYAAINKDIHAAVYYPKGYVPDFPAVNLDNIQVGTCRTFTDLNIARFRSIGVPVAKDFVPQWGSRSMNHEWVVLLPNENLCLPFGPNEKLSDHFFGREDHTLPKVFRYMYAKQEGLQPLLSSGERVPPLFSSPCVKDVTESYTHTTDVTIKLFDNFNYQDKKFYYVAVFDNVGWQIVDWGKRKGNKVTYKNLGRKVVYLPVNYLEDDAYEPIAHPFAIHEDGRVESIILDTTKRQQVRLIRKYRYTNWQKELCKRTQGGRFQVANKEDFSDSITIATIGNITETRFYSLLTEYDGSFRYFRYLAPDGSYGNMAEVEMYDDEGIRPKIKRMFGQRYAVNGHKLENLFDGEVLTFYSRRFPDDGWAAVEFEEPQHISRVRFLPRNDDNFIRDGEQYELFYWDGRRFASIARMEGNEEGVLYVDNVPTHALLLLRNLTKGKEERIFTYENGEQVWW